MPQSTPAQWDAARLQWQCDPQMTLLDVAHRLGVKLPTVSIRARRDGWVKLQQQSEERDAAHQVADVLGQISGRQELLEHVGTALDLSIGTRVAIVNRHRSDWQKHHALFTPEACAADPVAARRGKAAAEMLAIRQRGECIAYGLVTYTGQTTDAPLAEVVDEPDKPVPRWQRLLEAFATGASIDEFMTPAGAGVPRLEQDPNSDD